MVTAASVQLTVREKAQIRSRVASLAQRAERDGVLKTRQRGKDTIEHQHIVVPEKPHELKGLIYPQERDTLPPEIDLECNLGGCKGSWTIPEETIRSHF